MAVLMENHPGALSRLVGLFSQRGFNIETLCVSPTEIPEVSRLTLSTSGEELVLGQIQKQLNKLIEVIKVQDITRGEHIEREFMLTKVRPSQRRRAEVTALCNAFNGDIVDVFEGGYIVEMTGSADLLDAFLHQLREDEILEVARTGICALSKGTRVLKI